MNIRKSAVSFLLILCMMISLLPCFGSHNEVEAASGTGSYTYSVEISFGAFAFTYDYGIWNVNELDYVASDTSSHPAADTKDREPGWYGFDGINNRITVEFVDSASANHYIDVTVTFALETELSGVEMEGYRTSDFSSQSGVTNTANQYAFSVSHGQTDNHGDYKGIATYFSLSGVPQKGGSDYHSPTSNTNEILGTITIAVSKPIMGPAPN